VKGAAATSFSKTWFPRDGGAGFGSAVVLTVDGPGFRNTAVIGSRIDAAAVRSCCNGTLGLR
jgi:hypothetical protein